MSVAGTNGAVWPRGFSGRDGRYQGPLAVEKNTLGQTSFFFHRLLRLVAARRFDVTPTERLLAPGFLRRWWMRDPNADIFGSPDFSWSRNNFETHRAVNGVVSTTVGRYMTTASVRHMVGDALVNPLERAAVGFDRHAGQPPAYRAGQKKNNPSVRSRITSFGSRVPPVNNPYPQEVIPGA